MNNQSTIAADIISDNEIISRVLKGEKGLYTNIVRKYNQRLYRVGMSIINDDAEYLINEKLPVSMPEEFKNEITDVSETSNIDSMHELTVDYIEKNNFGDYRTSEPFYMKEFVPKN